MLRTNLELVRLEHDVKSVMITSAVEQEGKSTSAANLAVALAQSGQDVALVDLDLRRSFLDRFFGLTHRHGVTEVAIGHALLDEALVSVPFRDFSNGSPAQTRNGPGNGHVQITSPRSLHGGSLSVLVAGPLPPNPGDFVGSAALAAILQDLRERYDTVLIDTPPMLQVGDAMTLSRSIDALIVVTRMNVVRRPMLSELRRLLDSSPARKLGFLVTGADGPEAYGYGGYVGYGQVSPEGGTQSRTKVAR
jgi:Mrp family chromosome partitioning ATPase